MVVINGKAGSPESGLPCSTQTSEPDTTPSEPSTLTNHLSSLRACDMASLELDIGSLGYSVLEEIQQLAITTKSCNSKTI